MARRNLSYREDCQAVDHNSPYKSRYATRGTQFVMDNSQFPNNPIRPLNVTSYAATLSSTPAQVVGDVDVDSSGSSIKGTLYDIISKGVEQMISKVVLLLVTMASLAPGELDLASLMLVVVLCDSRSALESISGLSSPPSHPLRVQLLEECASLRDRSYELGYQWIPSHVLIMAVQQGPVICGGPVYNVNMAEKASKPSPTISVKPVPMRLFATLDVDKTPPNCISSSECSTNRQLSDAQRARVLAARCAVHYSYTKGVLVPTVF
uniref:Uncharacterized protein n=1 Tax=Timema bartmani TaxID=61472 RepID=A0A7R9F2P6_9NEOP|nr:unnamed protein product [Timema bartmani]